MENVRMDFPEVAGKTITEFSVLDDPEFGRELLLRFADGTQLSVAIGVKQTVDARYCREEEPERPIFTRRDP